MNFHYDDEEHTYRLDDGVLVPSLTGMLAADGLNSHLDAVPPSMLRVKAEWGTRLHLALQKAEYDIEFHAEFAPHAEAWLEVCRRMGWRPHGIAIWKNCELPAVANVDGFLYGFTPDRAAPEAVVEIKGTAAPHISHSIQTALQVLGMQYPRSTPRYVVYFDKYGLKKVHQCGPTILRDHVTLDVYEEAERIIFDHAREAR